MTLSRPQRDAKLVRFIRQGSFDDLVGCAEKWVGGQRRAAIVVIDVAAYSLLMGEDEEDALAAPKAIAARSGS
jgi:hypothetical protein